MKIGVHITFYYVESRLHYLQKVLDNFEKMPHEVQVFVYTNKNMPGKIKAKNIEYKIFDYRKSGALGYNSGVWNNLGLTRFVHPYHLAWENRKTVEQLVDNFDIQIYIEDDIAFTTENLNYWLKYKDVCLQNSYNLGFLRTEFDQKSDQSYFTELIRWPQETILINDQTFLLNDVSPYCGFWIYDQKELKEFIKTKEWKFDFKGYAIREKSAIGWHGPMMNRYKGTILPLHRSDRGDLLLSRACTVHHIPNTYIDHELYCQMKVLNLTEKI